MEFVSMRCFRPIREVLCLEEDGGPMAVEDFEEDLRRVWSCHPDLSREVKVDMLWNKIGSIHRDEIRCHPTADQLDPDAILRILHRVFGDQRSMGSLFLLLCAVRQVFGESVLCFSHRLTSAQRAYDRACLRADCSPLSHMELLRLFADGVLDPDSRRQLKYEVVKKPHQTFLELRELAFIWEAVPTPAPITTPLQPDPPPSIASVPTALKVDEDPPSDTVPQPAATPPRRHRRNRKRVTAPSCDLQAPAPKVTLYKHYRRHSAWPRDLTMNDKNIPKLMTVKFAPEFPPIPEVVKPDKLCWSYSYILLFCLIYLLLLY